MLRSPRAPLHEAAAKAPLKLEAGHYRFDPASFFNEVLALLSCRGQQVKCSRREKFPRGFLSAAVK